MWVSSSSPIEVNKINFYICFDCCTGDPDKRDQEEDEDVEAEDYLANLKAQQQAKRPQQGQQQQQQFYRN